MSTMRAIRARLAELPQSEREPPPGAAEEDRDDADHMELEEDLHQIQRVRTLRERPPTNDNIADDETPFQGELLKARHMKSPHTVGLFCPYSRSLLTLVWSAQGAAYEDNSNGVWKVRTQ